MRTRVYIAGPMSKGDRIENMAAALKAMRTLMRLKYAPMCPQLSFFAEPFMHDTQAEWLASHADWLGMDLPWVAVSQAVLRLPGASVGADMEEGQARLFGVPVFHSIEALIATIPPYEPDFGDKSCQPAAQAACP